MTSSTYIHQYLPGTDSAAPPLLLLHGTGGNEHDLLQVARRLSPGSALLSPRGDVLENGMPRFFRRFAEGVFDLADVERRTHALADFIAASAGQYGFQKDRLIALGLSNGANIASSLLLLRPESLAGAVLWRPMIVLNPAEVPPLQAKRVLITSGRRDPIVPVEDPPRLEAILRSGGADVSLRWIEAGHQLTSVDLSATQEFLASRA
jgi:phospholipase/carboxylesterase